MGSSTSLRQAAEHTQQQQHKGDMAARRVAAKHVRWPLELTGESCPPFASSCAAPSWAEPRKSSDAAPLFLWERRGVEDDEEKEEGDDDYDFANGGQSFVHTFSMAVGRTGRAQGEGLHRNGEETSPGEGRRDFQGWLQRAAEEDRGVTSPGKGRCLSYGTGQRGFPGPSSLFISSEGDGFDPRLLEAAGTCQGCGSSAPSAMQLPFGNTVDVVGDVEGDAELKVLMGRLKLYETQRALAALHCARFAAAMEADMLLVENSGRQEEPAAASTHRARGKSLPNERYPAAEENSEHPKERAYAGGRALEAVGSTWPSVFDTTTNRNRAPLDESQLLQRKRRTSRKRRVKHSKSTGVI